MIELKAVEADQAGDLNRDPRSQYVILPAQQADLKPGDEVLLLISRSPDGKQEEYGIPLRLTGELEPEEDEFIIQYKEKLFVAQKLPEFI